MRGKEEINSAIKALELERATMQRTHDFAKNDLAYKNMIFALKWCLDNDDLVIDSIIKRFQK